MTGCTFRHCQRVTCSKGMKMQIVGRFGNLVISEADGLMSVSRNGEVIFEGSVEEFMDVLERHKKFMDYIDSQEG